jgi:tetraacyldisaccharide 4'-kinase
MFFDFDLHLSYKNVWKWLPLFCLSLLYSTLVRSWLLIHRLSGNRINRSQKPVISIGNITTGGTGKTPMIAWFLDLCAKKKLSAAVLTRGYKAKRTARLHILDKENAEGGNSVIFGDEPWLLHLNFPETPLYISPDRWLSAQQAEKRSDLLLLDDGMQHLKLARDLNIVLIDAVSGIGNGKMIPLGPLREPLTSLKRADIVIYTKTNLHSSIDLRRELRPHIPEETPQFDSWYQPTDLISLSTGKSRHPEEIDQKRCVLFSGIGNARAFSKTVERIGGIVSHHLVLQDHQEYDSKTLSGVSHFIRRHPADFIICTEKDWVKLAESDEILPEAYYLKIKTKMPDSFESWMAHWLKENMR